MLDNQLLDTHSAPVSDPVWQLFDLWCQSRKGAEKIPCLLEWDSQLPDFNVLEQEKSKAEQVQFSARNSTMTIKV